MQNNLTTHEAANRIYLLLESHPPSSPLVSSAIKQLEACGPRMSKIFHPNFRPSEPSFFLLATPRRFYVFSLYDVDLYCAGESLEDVYEGIKEVRYNGSDEDDWVPVRWKKIGYEDFFPVYWLGSEGIQLTCPLKDYEEGRMKAAEAIKRG
jgi:hypothetical protein